MKTPTYLSKTKIMAGMQCPKNLFLQVYNKKLAAPITSAEQMIFDQGNLVGELAQKEFKEKTALVNTAYWDFKGALKQTEEFILQEKENIFEASFSYKGIFARVDILQKVKNSQGKDLWNLIEVKSGTKVKKENIKDMALQLWILENLGYKVQNCYLMYINNQCVFPNMSNFFNKQDISLQVQEVKESVANSILKLQKMLESQKEPSVDIGPHCSSPYECKFKAHCGKNLSKDSIFLLPSMEENNFKEASWKKKLWSFYKKNILEIKDIPVSDLNSKQQIAQKVHTKNQSYIDCKNISLNLKQWQQPLHYLSFNSINPAIPFWEGVRPYEQSVFQYSMCVQKNFDSEKNFDPDCIQKNFDPDCIQKNFDSGVVYKNYLHDNSKDPRLALAEQLVKDISKQGSIACYHKAFDGHKIKVLAELYPHLKKPLLNIIPRLVEPLMLFKKYVYLKSFRANLNNKSIALALFGKEMEYSNLNIKDEALMQMAYKNLIKKGIEDQSIGSAENSGSFSDQSVLDDLLEYGKKDVGVLVRLVGWLFEQRSS